MKRLKILAIIAAYIVTLLWAYVEVVAPNFAYEGYNVNWPGSAQLAWFFILALTPAMFLPIQLSRPSGLVAWWMYVTVYIPSTLLPALSLTLTPIRLLPLDIAMLLSMGFLTLVSSARVLSLPSLRVSPRVFWPALFLVWLGCLVFVSAHFNLGTLLLNLASLFLGGSEYTIRNGFFDQLSQAGRVLGYTTGQIGEAVDPFFISYGLVYRRMRLLAIGIAGQLMIFAVVGAKSILFSTFFLVIVFVLMRRFSRNFGLALGSLLIAVVLFSAAADRLSRGVFITSITTRRTLMDPGMLTGFYYEYYSQRAKAGLGYHFDQAGKAFPAPSSEIGLVYYGDEHVDANANLWAEGYADFGIPGVFGFTLILALVTWVYDSVAARSDMQFAVLSIAMQAFAFSNSAPSIVAITHGGIAVTFLLWCSRAAVSKEFERAGRLEEFEFGSAVIPKPELDRAHTRFVHGGSATPADDFRKRPLPGSPL